MVSNLTNQTMKTNQIFNFHRFWKYTKSTFLLSLKRNGLIWGTIATVVFFSSLITMGHNTSNWNYGGWVPLYLFILIVGGILLAGTSFPYFRSREKSILTLMVPVTSFEKLLYEVIEKIIVFIILFPVVFYLFSSFAVTLRNMITPGQIITCNGRNTFPFELISLKNIYWNRLDEDIQIPLLLGLISTCIALAGTTVFKKYPLIKTIVFIGAVMAVIAGYFVLYIQKLHFEHPWIESLTRHLKKDQGFAIAHIATLFACLVVLAFAYFKVKEKEVQ